ncbi:hypothetical protein L596_020714 [Steinernema carpocapsae]|uniref:Uncharacterized protein n=1 Tax=Steinernema carpocapsae TaxID=34508 RepID=A0A4U5MV09_STECR|nr:hypothetical protein L596_020714 [Steinernema carpocapsae]
MVQVLNNVQRSLDEPNKLYGTSEPGDMFLSYQKVVTFYFDANKAYHRFLIASFPRSPDRIERNYPGNTHGGRPKFQEACPGLYRRPRKSF